MAPQRFSATVVTGPGGRVFVPVPFDPNLVWGTKARHHITGTVNGMRIRGPLEPLEDGFGLVLGAAWRRDCGLAPGDHVDASLEAEGPQRDGLAPDVADALSANPAAGEFFDSLATFYRTGYLKWIEATKRRPDLRAARIAEMVDLLAAGVKQRPKPSRS